jgi:hypothetical protein
VDDVLPPSVEVAMQAGINDIDILEATDYYKTARGHAEHGPTRILFFAPRGGRGLGCLPFGRSAVDPTVAGGHR